MDFILKEVPICADKEFEMIKITDDVRKVVEESGVEKGIVYVITEHTTTGITVNESLPCVEKDLMECLDRIAPEDYPYHHNHYLPTYGTIGGNAPGHLKSLLTGNHCVFPVFDGTLLLGHAVEIYFCEFVAKTVVAMLGEYGSLAYENGKFYKLDAEKVEVVNTVGAGDSYIAAFTYGVSLGEDIMQCMRRGRQRATEIIQQFNPYK